MKSYFIGGLVGYLVLWLFSVIGLIRLYISKKRLYPYSKLQIHFHILLFCFLIVRIVWICFEGSSDITALLILNRYACTGFFTTFTYIIFFWAEIYHFLSHLSYRIGLDKLKIPFIIVNVCLYIATTVYSIIFIDDEVTHRKRGNSDPIYNSSVLLIAAISFVASLGFLVYGFLLLRQIKKAISVVSSKKKSLVRMGIFTVIFSLCFLCRFIILLYRPITNKFLAEGLYFSLSYYIPEMVPSLIQLSVMFPSFPKSFIQPIQEKETIFQNQDDESLQPYFLQTN
ncbi:tobamovirus multiplication protein 1-like isoform x1 [Anaeramoeba ignava]|uniref:Tobamovirus multiplication protein 1-like isoform x1 n=1 Tax=Anaeramoeba ignava TaxID=1746090 RepID=A0A9Q0LG61_ANAIG|nr:tobamovirus multiplication protein 1-like isoform x1 [Anaeramoeba ignava]